MKKYFKPILLTAAFVLIGAGCASGVTTDTSTAPQTDTSVTDEAMEKDGAVMEDEKMEGETMMEGDKLDKDGAVMESDKMEGDK